MAEVSDRLRAARERAGLRIEDISARTKIKAVQLQALERGEFERLPGEFFTRAFLRNYAREVGLSPEEVVRQYDAERGLPERAPAGTVVVESARQPHARRATVSDLGQLDYVDRDDGSGRMLSFASASGAWPILAVALVALIVISVVNRHSEGSGQAPAASAPRSAAATDAPGGPPQPAPTTGQAEPAPQMLTMEIQPAAEIWINARADGEQVIYRLVQPGERLKVQARNDLTFRIGNAAAFQYTINGAPGRTLGASGDVREFQVTRENFRTYRR